MREPGVYASCLYARITLGTVNRKTEVLHCLFKHQGSALFDFRLFIVR